MLYDNQFRIVQTSLKDGTSYFVIKRKFLNLFWITVEFGYEDSFKFPSFSGAKSALEDYIKNNFSPAVNSKDIIYSCTVFKSQTNMAGPGVEIFTDPRFVSDPKIQNEIATALDKSKNRYTCVVENQS